MEEGPLGILYHRVSVSEGTSSYMSVYEGERGDLLPFYMSEYEDGGRELHQNV